MLIAFLKRLQRLKHMAEKSSPGTRQTDGKSMVCFGENRKKSSQIINAYLYLPLFLLIIFDSFSSFPLFFLLMLLLFEVVRDYVEVLRLTWVYVGVTFLNYGTSLALYPAVAALVRPVSQESNPWNDIYFLPVWYAIFYTESET
jgi:hypothetical protein